MIRNSTLSIVIPCYNERHGIAMLLQHVHHEVDEVLVVDNNSTDGSGDIARAHGARVVFEARKGYGRAYKTGLAHARGDIIGTMDGDGSYQIEDIVKLAGLLVENELDFISGSRFPLRDWKSMHMKNYLGNIILTSAAAILFGLKINDSQSGMWVFRRSVLDLVSPASDGMAFSEEIKIGTFLNPGFKCAEIPIGYFTRTGSVKLHAWRDGWKNLKSLIVWRLRKRYKVAR